MKLPYGVSNFRNLILENYYYVDKTPSIEYIENSSDMNIFLLRPRRFGKSLFVSMLECYYGVQYKNEFQQIFGNLYIGKNPTPKANSYLVLKFEFSRIDTSSAEATKEGFRKNVIGGITDFLFNYSDVISQSNQSFLEQTEPSEILKDFFTLYKQNKSNRLIYILIDEYDHFANELIAFRINDFKDFVSRNGWVRKFYETIKTATGDGIIGRFFATGVTPITLDSLTSGFNIAANKTMDHRLNQSLGFTEEEVVALFEALVESKDITDFDMESILPSLKFWYNGYLFSTKSEKRVYNPDMLLFFAKEYANLELKEYPTEILDTNIITDYAKLQRFIELGNKPVNEQTVLRLAESLDTDVDLTIQYSFERPFNTSDFLSMLFYMGYLTITGREYSLLKMAIPNFVVRTVFYNYFIEKIQREAQAPTTEGDIYDAMRALANGNDIAPFVSIIETTLEHLSNRDLVKFDERYIKLLFVVFANFAKFYYIKSEAELNRRYADVMFLWRPPFFPKYQFLFELKYLKKEDSKKLSATSKQAVEQAKTYLHSPELKQLVRRPEGGIETVKAYAVVFVGTRCEFVQCVN